MNIAGKHYRTIWLEQGKVYWIDQRFLPFKLQIESCSDPMLLARAIKEMQVRGAPLIGVAGAYGAYLAAKMLAKKEVKISPASTAEFQHITDVILKTRPTAVNLHWAIEQQRQILKRCKSWSEAAEELRDEANRIAEDDVSKSKSIGEHGLKIIQELSKKKGGAALNILTHCNAGWLCAVDYGTATAPIYLAHRAGIPVHVWVDETRPRLQGSKLTAFELHEEGVPHTLIVDNAGGHLMQRGEVDLCIVGTDRTTRLGDVTNKIGTYLKALAAYDNQVPFYAAVPSSSIDWDLAEGRDVPIEDRGEAEILYVDGVCKEGLQVEIKIANPKSSARNPGFDVTPRKLLSGLITEHGVCKASESGLLSLFPEMKQ